MASYLLISYTEFYNDPWACSIFKNQNIESNFCTLFFSFLLISLLFRINSLISNMCVYAQLLSCVWLLVILWIVACQAPLPMEFSRQEYWSKLPFSNPGDLPDPGIEPASLTPPALARRFFTTAPVPLPSSAAISSCPGLSETRANILTKLSLAQPSLSSEIPCSGYPGLVSFPKHVWHSL